VLPTCDAPDAPWVHLQDMVKWLLRHMNVAMVLRQHAAHILSWEPSEAHRRQSYQILSTVHMPLQMHASVQHKSGRTFINKYATMPKGPAHEMAIDVITQHGETGAATLDSGKSSLMLSQSNAASY
jgi:hypothetical protein